MSKNAKPIIFTADVHIKLGQKNVPVDWARNRYISFFDQLDNMYNEASMLIVGGDLFDRLPSMDELELYFEFISRPTIPTIIYPGNHESVKKNTSFLTKLKDITNKINKNVLIIDEHMTTDPFGMFDFNILPFNKLHEKGIFDKLDTSKPLFTHVRAEIPPHVKPEIDLALTDRFPIVFAGDLHSHSNTQRNIVYPGSPMTTSFHRNEVKTGLLYIYPEKDWAWEWVELELPQLIRKTVSDPSEMVPTPYHHTVYELEGSLKELAAVENVELLDKKLVKKASESSLMLSKATSIREELAMYFSKVLELNKHEIESLLNTFNDYSKGAELE